MRNIELYIRINCCSKDSECSGTIPVDLEHHTPDLLTQFYKKMYS